MRLAAFEPDIAQNAAALIRLGACLGVAVDLIEPFGFVFEESRLKRVAMDYLALAEVSRHSSWERYLQDRRPGRLVLLTTRAELSYVAFAFEPTDTLLVGRESAGVPDAVHERAEARLKVPLRPPARSLNVVVAAAMVLGEALRQTRSFPG
ncbi:MAG: hypothetical protein JOZ17_08285 [Acetobacteraceae bacterium]|nr:hypothetical protein [Acetobacteraceae bacterium]